MVLAICGTTCVGKSFAKEAILRNRPDVRELRWYTTKPLSSKEHVGRHLSEEQFLRNREFGRLVLIESIDGDLFGFFRDDIIRDDVLFITEMYPEKFFELKKFEPKVIGISLITETTSEGFDILEKRMRRRFLPSCEIEKNLKLAKAEIMLAQDNYHYFDATVLVSRKNQENFVETIVSLANVLAP